MEMDILGGMPILAAVHKGDIKKVENLLDIGVDINIYEEHMGFTPLMVACIEGNLKMVKFLVKKGANINQGRKDGATPLIATIMSKAKFNIVKFLIDNNADPNLANDDGLTPLILAISFEDTELIAKYLITVKGIDLNQKHIIPSQKGAIKSASALFYAVIRKKFNIVKALTEAGADLNIQDEETGITPLLLAAGYVKDRNASREILDYLVEHGAHTIIKYQEGYLCLDLDTCSVGWSDDPALIEKLTKIDELNKKWEEHERNERKLP